MLFFLSFFFFSFFAFYSFSLPLLHTLFLTLFFFSLWYFVPHLSLSLSYSFSSLLPNLSLISPARLSFSYSLSLSLSLSLCFVSLFPLFLLSLSLSLSRRRLSVPFSYSLSRLTVTLSSSPSLSLSILACCFTLGCLPHSLSLCPSRSFAPFFVFAYLSLSHATFLAFPLSASLALSLFHAQSFSFSFYLLSSLLLRITSCLDINFTWALNFSLI